MLLKQSCFDTSPALLLSGCLLQRMADLVEFQNLFLARVWVGWLFFSHLKRSKLVFHLKMEDAKKQRWIPKTVSCSFPSDHPSNFCTVTIKTLHICKESTPICSSLKMSIMRAFILFFTNFWAWSTLLTLLERSADPCECHRIHWMYVGMKLETADEGEAGLSVVKLGKSHLPFLLSFPGFQCASGFLSSHNWKAHF